MDTGVVELLDRGGYFADGQGLEAIYLGMPDKEHFNLAYYLHGHLRDLEEGLWVG